MVKYMVPLLKQQGYSFVRLDETPDIAAALPSGGGGRACAFNPSWQQTTYANEWSSASSGPAMGSFFCVV